MSVLIRITYQNVRTKYWTKFPDSAITIHIEPCDGECEIYARLAVYYPREKSQVLKKLPLALRRRDQLTHQRKEQEDVPPKYDYEAHEKNRSAYFFFGVNHHFRGKFSCRRK